MEEEGVTLDDDDAVVGVDFEGAGVDDDDDDDSKTVERFLTE